jgi:Zn-dependent metalloprotease
MMCTKRKPYQCIVPPHVLRAMAESDDERVRKSALRTLLVSARVRGQREIVGPVRAALMSATVTGKKSRSIYDANNQFLNDSELPGKLVRSEGQPPSTDTAVNEAYDGLGATYDFYSKVYSRNSIDDRGMRLIATVHFGDGYNNAFWNGKEMIFGDGDGEVFVGFTRSLDVIGHELTHGVTEFTAALEYHKQPGALNESMSDVFGSLVKQYAANPKQPADKADWLIGAGILAPGINGVALRSMKDPGSAFDDPRLGGRDPQPKHMNDYLDMPDDEFNDFGGVHFNSGIPNYAFYLVASELGGYAWEEAGLIWYQALQQLWQTANFSDCANVTTQVAGTLFGTGSKQQQAVKSAWGEVGVKVTAPHFKVSKAKRAAVLVAAANGNGRDDLKKRLEELGGTLSETLREVAAALG